MLKIKNASAIIDKTEVLSDITLEINPGEIHAIMGPKESGKSSLAHIIQGNPFISVTDGSVSFNKKNLAKLTADKRSQLGIFTSFQIPPEIVGLTNLEAIKLMVKAAGQVTIGSDLESCYKDLIRELELGGTYASEYVNDEDRMPADWRKGEILQMLMINPKLAILDEIDTQQDDSSLILIAGAVTSFMKEKDKACIVITNNQIFLDLIQPTHVHILVGGKITEQGGPELYKRIVEDGYSQFSES